jgi:hypothetical protein
MGLSMLNIDRNFHTPHPAPFFFLSTTPTFVEIFPMPGDGKARQRHLAFTLVN